MAGTGYDEKQSGQLLLLEHHCKTKYKKVLKILFFKKKIRSTALLLEHHYKPFLDNEFVIRQRKSILRQDKCCVDFTCTKKSSFTEPL